LSNFLIAESVLSIVGLAIAAYCIVLKRQMDYIGSPAWYEREAPRLLAERDRREAAIARTLADIDAHRRAARTSAS
jgi:hypothetical protein